MPEHNPNYKAVIKKMGMIKFYFEAKIIFASEIF